MKECMRFNQSIWIKNIFSNLYFVAVNDDELVGVCYGHPSKRDKLVIGLQGIAVNLDEEFFKETTALPMRTAETVSQKLVRYFDVHSSIFLESIQKLVEVMLSQ